MPWMSQDEVNRLVSEERWTRTRLEELTGRFNYNQDRLSDYHGVVWRLLIIFDASFSDLGINPDKSNLLDRVKKALDAIDADESAKKARKALGLSKKESK